MSLVLLLTHGLSQDNDEICIPEEQVRILFEDSKLLPICLNKQEELYNLILNKNTTISIQDSIIINLEKEISLQNKLIKNSIDDLDWQTRALYLLSGIVVSGVIFNY